MKFKLGDEVHKVSGDYRFRGQVRAAFKKKNGAARYVVENDDGLLHIFSDGNLEKVAYPAEIEGT